jgi:hypothetical protein
MEEGLRLGAEGLEDVAAVLSGGGDDGAASGEGARAGEGSEGAADFHLDLHHPLVLLGQIVGEGTAKS